MIFKFWPKPPAPPEPVDSSDPEPEPRAPLVSLVVEEVVTAPLLQPSVLIVAAPSWFTARDHARQAFGTDDLECDPLPDDEEADVEMEWRGDDYRDHGDRKLWIRVRDLAGWGDWKEARI